MRAPPLISDFFEWRWAPCVGLTAGSLAFVALALLFIPTQFGEAASSSSPSGSTETALLDRAAASPPRALFGAALPRSMPNAGRDTEPPSPPARRDRVEAAVGVNEPAAPLGRGFSPIIDRPEPPPAPPAPAPPPPAAPAPAVVPVAAEIAPQPQAAGPAPDTANQPPQPPDPDGPRRESLVQ